MGSDTPHSASDDAPSHAQLHLERAERVASYVPGMEGAVSRTVDRVAVIGAGTMGSGIAVSLADAGIVVDLP